MKPYTFVFALLIFLISCSKDSEEDSMGPVDRTGPELKVTIIGSDTNSTAPVVTAGELEVHVDASDSGGISKVEIFLNGEKVAEDLTAPYEIRMDLAPFLANAEDSVNSNRILRITATDTAGNQSSVERTIIVSDRSPLITITIPEGFLNSFYANVHVFASGIDGQLLENTTVPILPTTRSVTLFAPEDFGIEEEFMLTFMTSIPRPDLNFLYASTFQNLTIDNPKEISLKAPDELRVIENRIFPAIGFDINNRAHGDGSDYRTHLRIAENEYSLQTLEPVNQPEKLTNKIFLWGYLDDNFTNYHYAIIDRPVPENFELNLDDMENDYAASGAISFTNYPEIPEIHTQLAIFGYDSEEDFENDTYHTVWNQGTANFVFPIRYGYYTEFQKYRYRLTMQHFHIEDEGLPLEEYTLPSWELNPAFSGNKVNLNTSGSGHAVGRLILREDAPNYMYDWRIIFNSAETAAIVIPELPEEFQDTPLSDNMSGNTLQIHQAEFRRYGDIPTYEDYLNKVLKEHKGDREVSEKKEIIFHSDIPVYIQYKDLFFD